MSSEIFLPPLKKTGILQVAPIGSSNFVTLPDPNSMDFAVQDLDSGDGSGRNLQGDMLRERVAIKEKLTLSFPPMYAEDAHQMLSAVAPVFFQCRYYSLKYGSVRTATMYVGDRSAKAYYNFKNSGKDIWTEFKMNFIEK